MASKVYKWSNVAVRVSNQEGILEKQVQNITKAAEPVVSCTGHGYAVGDYVWFNSDEGMTEIDNRVARIKSVTTDSFVLEKFDTTLFGTFEENKGSVRKLPMTVNMRAAQAVQSGGGGFSFEDVTTIHDGHRIEIPGPANAATFTFTCFWNPGDPALAELKKVSDAQDQRGFLIQFGVGGPIVAFIGYVGATLLPSGQAQGVVNTDVAVTMYGAPTYY